MITSGIPIGERPKSHEGIMGTNQQPWLPTDAIEFLEKNINSSHIGFEFGCGSSTFWFSKISKKIYSIESDFDWYSNILDLVKSNNIQNININCIPCEMKKIWDIDTEVGGNYIEYSNHILNYDFLFDYVIVDGVARPLCIKNSIDKIKSGGYLIIDNAERPAYHKSMLEIPNEWKVLEFINSVDRTIIYQKMDIK